MGLPGVLMLKFVKRLQGSVTMVWADPGTALWAVEACASLCLRSEFMVDSAV